MSSQSKTWVQATRRWCQEMTHKRSLSRDVDKFKYIHNFLGSLELSAIKRTHILQLIEQRKTEGCKPATINGYLALIKSVLRKARDDWEWIKEIPSIKILKLNNKRTTYLTVEDVVRLYTELPKHLQPIMSMALATGQRMSNICTMEWTEINDVVNIWFIPNYKSKNGKELKVLLNSKALNILKKQLCVHNRTGSRVFQFNGKNIDKANGRAWRKALKRAGLEGVHFHDLRHTWASRHVQAGTPLHVLKELGGWESDSSMKRYIHLSEEQLKKAAENIV